MKRSKLLHVQSSIHTDNSIYVFHCSYIVISFQWKSHCCSGYSDIPFATVGEIIMSLLSGDDCKFGRQGKHPSTCVNFELHLQVKLSYQSVKCHLLVRRVYFAVETETESYMFQLSHANNCKRNIKKNYHVFFSILTII